MNKNTNQEINDTITKKIQIDDIIKGPLKYDKKRDMYYYGVSLDKLPPNNKPIKWVNEELGIISLSDDD